MTNAISIQDITTAMKQAIEMDGDKLKKKFNAKVRFDIDGEEIEYDISSNQRKSSDDAAATDLIVVKTSLSTLKDIFEKKMTPQQAFIKGKIKFIGKMKLAMKLQIVLDATRKYLPPLQSRL